MPDDQSSSGPNSNGRLWQGLRNFFFGEREASLRDQIEDAIDDHEEDGTSAKGDLTLIERQMVRNLLHFGERTAGDVAVPRGDIIAVPEDIDFAALVATFAEAGHSRLPVYRDSLDTITGMIHIKDVFEILSRNETHRRRYSHSFANRFMCLNQWVCLICSPICARTKFIWRL